MSDSVPFHTFADNTKQTCIIIAVSLLLLVITMIAPTNIGRINISIGKLIAISLLGYAFLTNCKETTKLISDIPDLFSNSQLSSIRNNTIISYILSFSIITLILYTTYTIFF